MQATRYNAKLSHAKHVRVTYLVNVICTGKWLTNSCSTCLVGIRYFIAHCFLFITKIMLESDYLFQITGVCVRVCVCKGGIGKEYGLCFCCCRKQ